MAEPDEKRKKETDADQVIREYVESAGQPAAPEDAPESDVEWYDQVKQDTPTPAEAVVTGGDIDAAWDQAAVGDETVGGSSPTPDQDVVDEIGAAVGVSYEEGEPLRTTEKLKQRDEHRWEHNPASSEDYAERNQASAASPEPEAQPKRKPSAKRRKRKAA